MDPVQKLCLGGCGFFGSPANDGRCSVCFRDFVMNKPLLSATPASPSPSVTPSWIFKSRTRRWSKKINKVDNDKTVEDSDAKTEAGTSSESGKAKKRNRCFTCHKKIGLTGFDCRCGGVFCSLHRYSDMHGCSFDYKKMAAQEIQRNNPVVITAKIQKI